MTRCVLRNSFYCTRYIYKGPVTRADSVRVLTPPLGYAPQTRDLFFSFTPADDDRMRLVDLDWNCAAYQPAASFPGSASPRVNALECLVRAGTAADD